MIIMLITYIKCPLFNNDVFLSQFVCYQFFSCVDVPSHSNRAHGLSSFSQWIFLRVDLLVKTAVNFCVFQPSAAMTESDFRCFITSPPIRRRSTAAVLLHQRLVMPTTQLTIQGGLFSMFRAMATLIQMNHSTIHSPSTTRVINLSDLATIKQKVLQFEQAINRTQLVIVFYEQTHCVSLLKR